MSEYMTQEHSVYPTKWPLPHQKPWSPTDRAIHEYYGMLSSALRQRIYDIRKGGRIYPTDYKLLREGPNLTPDTIKALFTQSTIVYDIVKPIQWYPQSEVFIRTDGIRPVVYMCGLVFSRSRKRVTAWLNLVSMLMFSIVCIFFDHNCKL